MKKIIFILLSFLMSASVFAICGTPPGSINLDTVIADPIPAHDVGVDLSGRIIVSNYNGGPSGKGKVDVYSTAGAYITTIGSGSFNGNANGVGIDMTNGNILVTDYYGSGRVLVFSPTGALIGTIPGPFNWPTDVAVDSSGNVFVLDSNNMMIRKFGPHPSYNPLGMIPGPFIPTSGPMRTAIDSLDNIYVSNPNANEVLIFNNAGGLIGSIGGGPAGSGNGQFNQAWGIAIDEDDNVYITDLMNHRVQIFDSSGTYKTQFNNAGQMNGPYGVAIASDNKIVVPEWWGGKVNLYDAYCTQSQVCGNNILEFPEECDDGNLVDGDGCSSSCLSEEAAGDFDSVSVVDNGGGLYSYTFIDNGVNVLEIQNNNGLIDLSSFQFDYQNPNPSKVAVSVSNLLLTGTTKSITLPYKPMLCAVDADSFISGNVLGNWDCWSEPGRIVWASSKQNKCEGGFIQGKDKDGNILSQYTCEKIDAGGQYYAKMSGFSYSNAMGEEFPEGNGGESTIPEFSVVNILLGVLIVGLGSILMIKRKNI